MERLEYETSKIWNLWKSERDARLTNSKLNKWKMESLENGTNALFNIPWLRNTELKQTCVTSQVAS